jgi:hypothetical protein
LLAAALGVAGPPVEAGEAVEPVVRGLAARWTFDEPGAQADSDPAAIVRGGAMAGGAVLVEGPLGRAVAFDGRDGRFEVGSPPGLDLPAAMSLFAWIRCENVAAGGYGQCIYGQTAAGGNGGQYELCVGRGKQAGEVTVLWQDAEVCISAAKLQPGVWRHIGFTRRGEPGNWTCTLYVDGQPSGSAAGIAVDPGPALPFAIGRAGAYDGLYFHGAIDDVRIYDRALSPEEIAGLYRAR